MENRRAITVGAARVTMVNAGDMTLRLANEFAVPEEVWRPRYADVFDRPCLCPSLSALIEVNGARALVDTNDYRATVTPGSEYATPGYTPPPPIAEQLASLGVAPETVEAVIITHTHWDHFAGLTRLADGAYAPVYPQARVYLGQADWEDG